jgi:hypothetical protein
MTARPANVARIESALGPKPPHSGEPLRDDDMRHKTRLNRVGLRYGS